MPCIFCEIIARRAPASIIYENDAIIAFMGIQPTAPGECLVIPKTHIDHFTDVPEATALEMMAIGHRIGRRLRDEFSPERVGYLVHGYGVPHAHLVIVPQQGPYHLTSEKFAHVIDGRVMFDMRNIPYVPRDVLDEHARRLTIGS